MLAAARPKRNEPGGPAGPGEHLPTRRRAKKNSTPPCCKWCSNSTIDSPNRIRPIPSCRSSPRQPSAGWPNSIAGWKSSTRQPPTMAVPRKSMPGSNKSFPRSRGMRVPPRLDVSMRLGRAARDGRYGGTSQRAGMPSRPATVAADLSRRRFDQEEIHPFLASQSAQWTLGVMRPARPARKDETERSMRESDRVATATDRRSRTADRAYLGGLIAMQHDVG